MHQKQPPAKVAFWVLVAMAGVAPVIRVHEVARIMARVRTADGRRFMRHLGFFRRLSPLQGKRGGGN